MGSSFRPRRLWPSWRRARCFGHLGRPDRRGPRNVGARGSAYGHRRDDGFPLTFQAQRVYLAAGAISSSRILLRSLKAYGRTIPLLDSQYFLFPLVRYAATGGVRTERLHRLAQAFLEIQDSAVSPHTVHLQVYTYNDLYEGALRKTLGGALRVARPVIPLLLRRLLIMQGYLHSDHSPVIDLTLERQPGGSDRLRLEGARTEPRPDERDAAARGAQGVPESTLAARRSARSALESDSSRPRLP